MTRSRRDRLDLPDWSLDAYERIQDWPAVHFLTSALSGSKDTSLRTVDAIVDADGVPLDLPITERNRRTFFVHSVIRRLMRKAVVVGVDIDSLDKIIEETGAKGEVAGAFTTSKGVTRAIILQYGIAELGVLNEPNLYTLAFREGPNDFGAGIGVFLHEEKTLIAPRSQIFVENHVPVRKLMKTSDYGYPMLP